MTELKAMCHLLTASPGSGIDAGLPQAKHADEQKVMSLLLSNNFTFQFQLNLTRPLMVSLTKRFTLNNPVQSPQ